MSHHATPTPQDYKRLRRALLGVMVIVLANTLAVFAIQTTWADMPIAEGLFCLFCCSLPLLAFFRLVQDLFKPQDDPTYRRYIRTSRIARRSCLWGGCVCAVLGFVAIPFIDNEPFPYLVWFAVSGVLLAIWSFQFPRVERANDDPPRAKPGQFFVRRWLLVTYVVAVYMGLVVWKRDPQESLIMRLMEPLVEMSLLFGAIWFLWTVVAFFVVPLAWICLGVAKLVRRMANKNSELTS